MLMFRAGPEILGTLGYQVKGLIKKCNVIGECFIRLCSGPAFSLICSFT